MQIILFSGLIFLNFFIAQISLAAGNAAELEPQTKASSPASVVTDENQPKQNDSLPADVEPESSAHERIRRKNTLFFAADWFNNKKTGTILGVARSLSHKVQLEAAYGDGAGSFLSRYSFRATRLSGTLNYFNGNAFYVSSSAFWETLRSGLIGEYGTPFADNDFKANIQYVNLHAGFGTRWNWGPLFLGQEWFGLSWPVFIVQEKYSWNEKFDASMFSVSKVGHRSFIRRTEWTFFNTSLGYSF